MSEIKGRRRKRKQTLGKKSLIVMNVEAEVRKAKKIGIKKWLLNELARAFDDARKGKVKTRDEHKFEVNWVENLTRLRDSILELRYEPSPSITFVIFEPMVREIFAAPFRDRVIHHFLYNAQAGWWDRRFLYDSYSCRVGKGTLFGVLRTQRFMRIATENFTKEAFIIKLDIRGYFMSLPRKELYKKVDMGLRAQFKDVMSDPVGYKMYQIYAFLWRKVLFDDPVEKAIRRGTLENWAPEVLPFEKSLFWQVPGVGIVIGNLTSQLVSNIYLDALDRFIYYTLGYKYYGRYVDDFYMIVREKEYMVAKKDVELIEGFLKEELRLTLHKKKRYFQSVYKGMSFLGVRIYPRSLAPSDRLQKNFRQAAREVASGQRNVESIVSYLGIMEHLDAEKLINSVFSEFGWRRR